MRAKHIAHTFDMDLANIFAEMDANYNTLRWPNTKYRQNPKGFFNDILGVEIWDKQAQLMQAVCDNDYVACKASQKVSKTHTVMGMALWWYCSVVNAKVRMTSVTGKQIEVCCSHS